MFSGLAPDSPGTLKLMSELELDMLSCMQAAQLDGLHAAITGLNSNGHALREVEREGNFIAFTETLGDSDKLVRISATLSPEEDFYTAYVQFTDASDNVLVSPEEQAELDMQDQFYQRYEDLVGLSDDELSGLSRDRHLVYAIGLLEAEVNNGGFMQYFDNTEGRLAEQTLRYLEEIKAPIAAGLLAKAMELFSPLPEKDKDTWYDRLDDIEAGQGDMLEKLDREYYDNVENLSVLTISFLDK